MSVNVDSKRGKPNNTLRFAISAACAGVPAAQVQAQIEEIIVTATKREANLQDIPISVTAFGAEEIIRQGFKTFSDYVGQVPGLSVVERQPGATNVLMRGCAAQGLSFADSGTTSVYLDEQPITASGFNPDPRLVDIERVEALGGPQGTLFGDAAQCGTLRVITNKPSTTGFNGWVDVNGMVVEDGDTGYDFSGMVNVPLVQDKLALRLVGFVAEEPGWIDNVLSASPGSEPSLGTDPGENFDNSALVRKDVNTSKYYGGRAGLRWNATEDWTVDFAAIYQKYELDGFGEVSLNDTGPNELSLYADTSTFPRLGEYDQVRFNEETWDDEWYQLAVTAEGSLGFADLVVTGAYFKRDNEYNADATAYLQAFQQIGDYYRANVDPAATIYEFNGDPRANAIDTRETESFTLEARLQSNNDDSRWSWIAGVFFNHREVDELFISNLDNLWNAGTQETAGGYYLNYSVYNSNAGSSARSNNWFTGLYDTELDQWAVFGEVSFDFTENLALTVGGRFYDIENNFTLVNAALVGLDGGPPNCNTDYCFTGQDDTGEGKDDGFVPKVNLTYTWDNGLVYATYSEGFRRGGVNSARPNSIFGTPGVFPPPAGAFQQYDADTVNNYEIGAKTDWLDNTLRINITAYFMEWEDIQVQVVDTVTAGFNPGFVNAPEAEITGVETWAAWVPNDSWDFSATLGYNKGELSKDFNFPNTPTVPDGTRLPLMPEWKASLNAQYTFGGTLFSATPYVLAQYVYWGDSTNNLGIETTLFENPIREHPDWQTLDLRIGLEGETWEATFWVDNLFDEYQELFYNNRWAQQRLTTGMPRNFGIGFRKYFGED